MTAWTGQLMDQANPIHSLGGETMRADQTAATTPVDKKRWFEQVYTDHHRVVFGFLRARVLDHADADDLTQEVFLRFYSGLGRYDPTRNPDARPWLRGISRNVLREHIRKIKRRKETGWTELCLELDDLIGGAIDEDDRLNLLPTCINQLGDSARHAIRAHYMQGKKLKVIAQEMDRTVGAVKVLMVRSRQALRKCVEAELARTASGRGAPTHDANEPTATSKDAAPGQAEAGR